MNLLLLILSGVGIGVFVAAPVGPVNMICIRRTLAFGRLDGFLSGTGAALGDGFFAIIVAFGLTAVSSFIEDHMLTLKFFGSFVLLIFGIHTFFANPRPFANPKDVSLPNQQSGGGIGTAVGTTFLLTVTNPATMLAFFALFAGLDETLIVDASYTTAAILVGSVIVGSALWWAALTGFMGLFKGKMTLKRLKRINQISGVLVGLFGLVMLGDVAWTLLF